MFSAPVEIFRTIGGFYQERIMEAQEKDEKEGKSGMDWKNGGKAPASSNVNTRSVSLPTKWPLAPSKEERW
jgi:hypothetical protein